MFVIVKHNTSTFRCHGFVIIFKSILINIGVRYLKVSLLKNIKNRKIVRYISLREVLHYIFEYLYKIQFLPSIEINKKRLFLRAHISIEHLTFIKVSISVPVQCILKILQKTSTIVCRFLSYALQNDSSIRNQDIYKVFYALTNKVAGQEVAWNYVRDNWRSLKST